MDIEHFVYIGFLKPIHEMRPQNLSASVKTYFNIIPNEKLPT